VRPAILAASADSKGPSRARSSCCRGHSRRAGSRRTDQRGTVQDGSDQRGVRGGGNSGATYTNDFIELTNLSSTVVAALTFALIALRRMREMPI
jgi:hypothetical protein